MADVIRRNHPGGEPHRADEIHVHHRPRKRSWWPWEMTMQRILSKLPSWELDHEEEDIRGWPIRDAEGHLIGTVSDLVADTHSKCVTQVVLASGKRIPAHDLWLGDHVVTLGTRAENTHSRPRPN